MIKFITGKEEFTGEGKLGHLELTIDLLSSGGRFQYEFFSHNAELGTDVAREHKWFESQEDLIEYLTSLPIIHIIKWTRLS